MKKSRLGLILILFCFAFSACQVNGRSYSKKRKKKNCDCPGWSQNVLKKSIITSPKTITMEFKFEV